MKQDKHMQSYYCNAVTIVIKMLLRDVVILITDHLSLKSM